MDGQMDQQIAECVNVELMNGHLICWMDGWCVIGWKVGQMNGWMNKQMDTWIDDGWMDSLTILTSLMKKGLMHKWIDGFIWMTIDTSPPILANYNPNSIIL